MSELLSRLEEDQCCRGLQDRGGRHDADHVGPEGQHPLIVVSAINRIRLNTATCVPPMISHMCSFIGWWYSDSTVCQDSSSIAEAWRISLWLFADVAKVVVVGRLLLRGLIGSFPMPASYLLRPHRPLRHSIPAAHVIDGYSLDCESSGLIR